MSGAPVVVTCYRNGIDSYGTWVTDATAMRRVRELAAEGGASLVGDVIWYGREPWTTAITSAWPAVDTFDVSLALDTDHTPPGGETVARKKPKKQRRGR